ncbi:methyltransferase [Archangium violaceum]|uniref:methyltransferase n=1 Tax=Archangium violaceum TaxID=83451 RepID=UPI002B284F5A|nr:methyltransferase [Archangium gephyra]
MTGAGPARSWYVYTDYRLLNQDVKLDRERKYCDPNRVDPPGQTAPRDAYTEDSKLLLIEQLLPERKLSGVQMFIDLTMMAMFGSKERTETEFQALFAQAELELTRTIDLVNGYAIIEAKPKGCLSCRARC